MHIVARYRVSRAIYGFFINQNIYTGITAKLEPCLHWDNIKMYVESQSRATHTVKARQANEV